MPESAGNSAFLMLDKFGVQKRYGGEVFLGPFRGRGWRSGIQIHERRADADMVELVVFGIPIAESTRGGEDGVQRSLEVGVVGIGKRTAKVGDGFDAPVKGGFRVPSLRRHAASDEAIRHPC